MSANVFPVPFSGIQETLIDAKGDLIVGSAADTAIRLAVGSNNQVLTADSAVTGGVKWATASAGGLTLIETLSLSGSSVTSATLPTTYKNLYIEAIDYYASGANLFGLRPNNDSGTNYTLFSVRFQSSGTNFGPSGGAAGTSITQIDPNDIGTPTSSKKNVTITTIYRYNDTDTYKLAHVLNHHMDNSDVKGTTILNSTWRSTAAITSLTFFMASGTFSGGSVKIYGVN